MSVRIYWQDDQKTILRHVYEGRCEASDFHACVNESYRLISTVVHAVDVIVDMTKASFVGTSFLTVRGNSEAKVQENQRLAILVGAPGFIKALVSIGKKIAPKTTKNIHYVNTVEEAHVIIGKEYEAAARN